MNSVKSFVFAAAFVFGGMVLMTVYYGINAPSQGEIIKKTYTPASYSTLSETPDYRPEQYTIIIEQKDEEGKTWKATVALDKTMFYEVRLGEVFDRDCYCIIGEKLK